MDYKDTLHLPQTAFEMRGNLTKKQQAFVDRWQSENLYQQMQKANQDCPLYVLHDGPPFANGEIHIGHALNKILKDFIVRSRHKLGYLVNYIPGWDTHGLPIETVMAKKGIKRKEMPMSEYRNLCQQYAESQIEGQMRDFKRLGTIGDYDHRYITYLKDFEATQVRLFGKMCTKGMIYKGLKPVYWSPSSESALAEAEIEYKDKEDASIYVAFQVKDGKNILDENTYFVIWTTTPWTIPANLGISLNGDFTYAAVKVHDKTYIMLASLVDELMALFKFENYQITAHYQGRDLEYITCQHPLYDRTSLVMVGDHVSADSGTGCVHTAPGFGYEDYLIGKEYGLEIYCNVDAQGRMMESSGEWLAGQTTDAANNLVIDKLKETGHLLNVTMITHSYPHDWRTKKPIIYRATPQWFASIDMIKEDLFNTIQNDVKWKPSWGQLRMYNMIKDRSDWTISRQRAWGLPIPIFYAENGEPIMDEALFEHVADLFLQYGSNIWFEKEAKELMPKGYTHPASPNGQFTKEQDILDVWFDSGSSHTAALAKHGISLPVDLYLEGSDQYRGWFNSSLTIATAIYGHAPYKQVLSHGFVNDDKGEKYSKSSGKALSPNNILDRLGADILRLWVASVDYTSDVVLNEELLKQVSENYRKIRNTFRFMAGNISDLPADYQVDFNQLPLVDRHVLKEINQVLATSYRDYENYDFQTIINRVTVLLTNTLSAYYMDFTKDILYIHHRNDVRRRQVQAVLAYALKGLMHLLTPILPFTMEELHDILASAKESVQLAHFMPITEVNVSEAEQGLLEQLFALRESVYKALEEARANKVIGNSLKAEVVLHIDSKLQEQIQQVFKDDFKQWLIVSKVSFVEQSLPLVLEYEVMIKEAIGITCERCWNVVSETAEGICLRCQYHLKHDH